eukprot:scaffold90244_cov51-Phaeocystis_antarctica.AAC.3
MRACGGAAARRRRRCRYRGSRPSLRWLSAGGRARLRKLRLRWRQLLQLRGPELAGGKQGLDAVVSSMLWQLSAALTPHLAPHWLHGRRGPLRWHVHVDRVERQPLALPRSVQRRGGRAAPGSCRDGRSPQALPCPAVTRRRVAAMQCGGVADRLAPAAAACCDGGTLWASKGAKGSGAGADTARAAAAGAAGTAGAAGLDAATGGGGAEAAVATAACAVAMATRAAVAAAAERLGGAAAEGAAGGSAAWSW